MRDRPPEVRAVIAGLGKISQTDRGRGAIAHRFWETLALVQMLLYTLFACFNSGPGIFLPLYQNHLRQADILHQD